MKNLQFIMLAALLIAATEHVDASVRSGSGKASSTSGSSTSSGSSNGQVSSRGKSIKESINNWRSNRIESARVAKTQKELFRQEAAKQRELNGPESSSPSMMSQAGTAVYKAGQAVYNAPGSAVRYISGGKHNGKFITGETGSLNSAGKSFNRSLELQMNRPTKAKASALEFDNKIDNSSVSDSTISSSEGTPSIAESTISDGAAPSYSSRAYQAARAVYHTPGTLARMAIGEQAMTANNYDGNVMQNAPRNLYNAAVATPSAIYNAPGNTVQYLKLGQKDFISGKEGNSLRTFTNARMAKSKPKVEQLDVLSETSSADGDVVIFDRSTTYKPAAKKTNQNEWDSMDGELY